MAIYMYQAAYTAESWAAQVKKPANRVEAVGSAACEAVGGKLLGGWYCFGDYDLVIIADVPNNESIGHSRWRRYQVQQDDRADDGLGNLGSPEEGNRRRQGL